MTTYDCFPLFNELDVLELRLRHLDSLPHRPDRFVIVESTKTFAGADKPLYYLDNRERFAAWQDRITHVTVDDELVTVDGTARRLPWPDGVPDNWKREIHQRNAVTYALEALGAADDDLALLSDVDEIPHQIPRSLGPMAAQGFVLQYKQAFYYYTLQHRRGEPWVGTKLTTVGTLRRHTPERVRAWGRVEPYPASVPWGEVDGGWHFSHLYGADISRYQAKLAAGSHQEYNRPEYTDAQAILARVAAGKDLFDRPVPMLVTPIDDTYPAVVRDDLARWWPYLVQE